MSPPQPPSNTRASKILTEALEKTDRVQEDLTAVAEDLEQANAVLAHPQVIAQVATVVADAVALNVATESRVQDAVDELDEVRELIKDAQVEQSSAKTVGRVGEGTASLLKYFEGRPEPTRDDESPGKT